MINDNENEAENKKQITKMQHKFDLGLDTGTNTLNIKCVLV